MAGGSFALDKGSPAMGEMIDAVSLTQMDRVDNPRRLDWLAAAVLAQGISHITHEDRAYRVLQYDLTLSRESPIGITRLPTRYP